MKGSFLQSHDPSLTGQESRERLGDIHGLIEIDIGHRVSSPVISRIVRVVLLDRQNRWDTSSLKVNHDKTKKTIEESRMMVKACMWQQNLNHTWKDT